MGAAGVRNDNTAPMPQSECPECGSSASEEAQPPDRPATVKRASEMSDHTVPGNVKQKVFVEPPKSKIHSADAGNHKVFHEAARLLGIHDGPRERKQAPRWLKSSEAE